MDYGPEVVKRLTINPIEEKLLDRVASAMDDLTDLFGRVWVDACLNPFNLISVSASSGLPIDALIFQNTDFEDLFVLWEDLQVLRTYQGFDRLCKKLSKGRRFENVDLEISVASDFCRLAAEFELEPILDDNRSMADFRFKPRSVDDWVYAEVTRKSGGKPVDLVQTRGKRLASLVAARDPSRRNYIAVTRPMDPKFSDEDLEELAAWIPSSAPNASFREIAFVGVVDHNSDETSIVLPHFPAPVSVIQVGDVENGAFGVAYLRVPDFGAENKIRDKLHQVMAGMETLLIIDLTPTNATQAEWDDRISSFEIARSFSAVITVRDSLGVGGYTRKTRITDLQGATVALSEQTRHVLEIASGMRINRSFR